MTNYLRKCVFRPPTGATFTLITKEKGFSCEMGKERIGYKLHCKLDDRASFVLFEGEDFYCSPCHGIDSDECVSSLMSFLTLRPGDTDEEYFENYTATQQWYCDQHAEYLGCEVYCRFNGERD
jgi:hypothetical protein